MPDGPVSQAVLLDSVYTVDEKYLILMEYLLGWFNFHVKKKRQEEQLFSCDGKLHLVVCDHVDNSQQVSSLSMSQPIFKISCIFSHKNDLPCKCGDHASLFLLSIYLSDRPSTDSFYIRRGIQGSFVSVARGYGPGRILISSALFITERGAFAKIME